MDNNIKFYQGNSFDALIPVINKTTGLSVDISAYTASVTIRKKLKDPEIVLTKALAIAANKIQLSFISTETLLPAGSYVYDVVIVLNGDVKTVIQASIKVMDSVKY